MLWNRPRVMSAVVPNGGAQEMDMTIDSATAPTLVERDSRGRVPLGKFSDEDRFLVTVDDSGTITLEPAVVMTRAQAAYAQRPDAQRAVEASLAGPRSARPRPKRA